ncbi:hypothetical protein OCS_05623 [Ophiocordyceps sinensis CO18]|uniref:Uncharacterized protein n=1 Tax=Ophiocordyceps sinensis (strain Co18 / CGMCC 3.14243) TaxID=911162 RepID=T5A8E6_OPHSC|nr:hypothetical protein OCS_05623 [Ophiocordyceps sinensis CO18]
MPKTGDWFLDAGDTPVMKSKGLPPPIPPPLRGGGVGIWASDDVDVFGSAGGCGERGLAVDASEARLLVGSATMLVGIATMLVGIATMLVVGVVPEMLVVGVVLEMLVVGVMLGGNKVGAIVPVTLGVLLNVGVAKLSVADIDRDVVTITELSGLDPVPHRTEERRPFCA